MRMPTTLTSEQWCKHVLILLVLVASSSHTMGFLPSHQGTSRNRITSSSSSSALLRPLTMESSFTRQRFHPAGRHSATSTPIDEDEKINPNNRNRDDDSNQDNADWIPTKGGFIPNLGNLLGRTKQANSSSKTASSSSRIMTVNNLLDYKRHVVDETDRMVCVRFYAPWCRACKAVAPMFARLASQYPTVKFVEVPLTQDNAFMLQGLGVPSLPYGHIYHPQAGLVEERKMNKKVFGTLAYVLSTYVHGECILDDYEKLLQKSEQSGSSDDHQDTILKP